MSQNEKEPLLTIRIPRGLRDEIKEFAQSRGTTITKLTLDYYRYLINQEREQEAKQI